MQVPPDTNATPRIDLGVITPKELCVKLGLSRTTLYELIKTGAFPRPIDLTPTGTRTGFLVSEIEAWLAERAAARGRPRAAAA